MTRAITLLQVEDSENDAAFIVRMLEKAGYQVDAQRVETEEQMQKALKARAPDLVIVDYRLPAFSAPQALRVFRETGLDVPFIVVSGVMSSETAVSLMKAGAHDFLLKDRLERLVPAVERELNEAAIRREKREADDKLRVANAELEAALAQNAVLFQEVHHRVKNNLQIVASLLSMKAREGKEQIGAQDLKDCELRIRSMAMIHEQLYNQKDMSVLDFAGYVKKIVPEMITSYERSGFVSLRLEVSPTVLSIDQSIPCGLILNELITNAIKYAYPDGRGEIMIGLTSDEQDVQLTVADQGVGMAADAAGRTTSMGLQIVHMLAKQLGGTIQFGPGPGATVTLNFPLTGRASN